MRELRAHVGHDRSLAVAGSFRGEPDRLADRRAGAVRPDHEATDESAGVGLQLHVMIVYAQARELARDDAAAARLEGRQGGRLDEAILHDVAEIGLSRV